MTDQSPLLPAILADPDDDLCRLVYADWLDDGGGDGGPWRANRPPEHLGYGYGDDGSGGNGFGGGGGGYGNGGDGNGNGGGSGRGGGGGGYGNGSGDGDDGDDGYGGSGYGGYGDGGRGYGGEARQYDPERKRVMPAIGDCVLILSEGNYRPYAYAGRVTALLGPRDYVLDDASLLTYAGDIGTWSGIAAGDAAMRRGMRVRREGGPIEVYGVQACRPWAGELPTKDQG